MIILYYIYAISILSILQIHVHFLITDLFSNIRVKLIIIVIIINYIFTDHVIFT